MTPAPASAACSTDNTAVVVGLGLGAQLAVVPYSSDYDYFMIAFSMITSMNGLIQAHDLFYHPDQSKGVSNIAWVMTLLSNSSWLVYGLMKGDVSLVLSSCLSVAGAALVLLLKQLYDADSILAMLKRCRPEHLWVLIDNYFGGID